MISKRNLSCLALGAVSVIVFSCSTVSAQCNGGPGGAMPTSSASGLAMSISGSPNALASIYPSSITLMAAQPQQQVLQVQQQFAAIAYQNSERQRLAAIAREELARPYRLARAEAKRAASAERIAARLRQQATPSPSDLRSIGSVAAR